MASPLRNITTNMSAILNQENVESNKRKKSEASSPKENQKADAHSPRKLNTVEFEQKINRPIENISPEETIQPTRPEKCSPLKLNTVRFEQKELRIQKRNPKAKIPVRGSDGAAGYDLSSCVDIIVPAWGKALVATGLALELPEGTYGRVAPRSGLAVKNSLDCGAGVIDSDYRGELFVLLFNFSDKDYQIKEGDRIAQLILELNCTPEVKEVETLDDTTRGKNGFGSTGR